MQFRQIPVVFARSPNHFPKVTTLLFVCSAVSFVNDKGQRDTYQYVKSGNGQIAHINGIMSELIYLSDIRQKIISAKKIESLTLQSVTPCAAASGLRPSSSTRLWPPTSACRSSKC